MFAPLLAIFAQGIGGDILDITWAWATYLLVAGILTIFVGNLSDKISKKKLIFAGYLLNTIFTFSYILVYNQVSLLIVQAGLGIAAALATPTWNALYSEYEDKKRDGLEWGLSDGLSQFLTGIAILLGGLVIVNYSFKTLFIIMGIIQLIATLRLIPILKKRR